METMEVRKAMAIALNEAIQEVNQALDESLNLPLGAFKELVLLGQVALPPIHLSEKNSIRVWIEFVLYNGRPAFTREVVIKAPSRSFRGTMFPDGEEVLLFILPEHPSKVLEVVRGLEGWAEELRRLTREAREKYARALEEEKEALDELRARAALKGLGNA